MILKFYYDTFSQPCRALYIFLSVNKIPFEKCYVNLAIGEHRKREYRNINPMGLVPVINDNGFILKESVGILRYLVREKNLPDHWYPRESKAQAKVDEFIEWQHLGLRMPLASFFRITKMKPFLTGESPSESQVTKLMVAVVKSCDLFENAWLIDGQKFLFGEKLSIADLLAAMELEQPRMAGYDPKNGRPKLAAYMDRVRNETNPYYDEACEIIYNFMDNSKL